jgi:hypothetical protein
LQEDKAERIGTPPVSGIKAQVINVMYLRPVGFQGTNCRVVESWEPGGFRYHGGWVARVLKNFRNSIPMDIISLWIKD